MSDLSFFQSVLSTHISEKTTVTQTSFVSGGCINNTIKLETNEGSFFIKWNSRDQVDLFEKEASGLQLLRKKSGLEIPNVLGYGQVDNKAYLLLTWIEKGPENQSFWELFGKLLAQQHKQSHQTFGLDFDNHIGKLPQSNHEHQDWNTFFIEERIEPQLRLAEQNGLIGSAIRNDFEQLFIKLANLLPAEAPALLHGDLWSGNFMCNESIKPVVFDPAVYYGHREAELAFTTLFGGFNGLFYESYRSEFPLESGFEDRIEIYNLYPLLVHVNLFGSSYLSGILSTLKRFTP